MTEFDVFEEIELFEETDAPPDVVWEVLLEFDSYPEWNPFVRAIEGTPAKGRGYSSGGRSAARSFHCCSIGSRWSGASPP